MSSRPCPSRGSGGGTFLWLPVLGPGILGLWTRPSSPCLCSHVDLEVTGIIQALTPANPLFPKDITLPGSGVRKWTHGFKSRLSNHDPPGTGTSLTELLAGPPRLQGWGSSSSVCTLLAPALPASCLSSMIDGERGRVIILQLLKNFEKDTSLWQEQGGWGGPNEGGGPASSVPRGWRLGLVSLF